MTSFTQKVKSMLTLFGRGRHYGHNKRHYYRFLNYAKSNQLANYASNVNIIAMVKPLILIIFGVYVMLYNPQYTLYHLRRLGYLRSKSICRDG